MKVRKCPKCHARIEIEGKTVRIYPAKRKIKGFYAATCEECKKWIEEMLNF